MLTICLVISLFNIIDAMSQEVSDKLEANVKQLKDWDYVTLVKYVEKSSRDQVEKDVAKMIGMVDSKQFTEIEDDFVKWFNQAFELFGKIKNFLDTGYIFNEKSNIWEKNETGTDTTTETKSSLSTEATEKLEGQVKQLKEINYLNLLKYVDAADRDKITTDVEKIITLVENKQFGDIDDKMVEWFNKVVELFTNINRYLVDGYILDKKSNIWTKNVIETEPSLNEKSIDELEKMGNELETWNFKELINNLEEPDKEKAEPVITKMITLLKNKQHTEIDPDLVKEFHRIYKLVREARPVVNTKIIQKVTEIDNVDWEKILSEVEGIDQNVWRRRIRRVIEQAKTRPQSRIEYPWLRELRRIVRVIHKEARPMRPIKLRRFLQRMRYLTKVDWRRGLRQIRGIDYGRWERRFEKVLYHLKHYPNTRMRFPWLRKLRRMVRVIYNRSLPVHPIRPIRRIRPIYVVRPGRPIYRERSVRPFHQIRGHFHKC